MEIARRVLQIIRFAFLASIALYAYLVVSVPSHAAPSPVIFLPISLIAVTLLIGVFITRRIFLARTEKILAVKPEDGEALARWRTGYLVAYALSEAIVLFGFMLHFMGFSLRQVAPFFLTGFLLILFSAPHRVTDISNMSG